jgi:hypothetical protein
MQTLNQDFLRTAGLIHAELAHRPSEIDSLVLTEAPRQWRGPQRPVSSQPGLARSFKSAAMSTLETVIMPRTLALSKKWN